MAEVRGKFVTMAIDLVRSKPDLREKAIEEIRRVTGKNYDELDPEGFYPMSVVNIIYELIEQSLHPLLAWATIKVIGQQVFPTIKETVGLPEQLKTPVDFIKFEAQTFVHNHRGPDVIPRRIIKAEERDVIVEAPSPGYTCSFMEGVYDGILRMNGILDGKVTQTRCIRKGDDTCEYHITW